MCYGSFTHPLCFKRAVPPTGKEHGDGLASSKGPVFQTAMCFNRGGVKYLWHLLATTRYMLCLLCIQSLRRTVLFYTVSERYLCQSFIFKYVSWLMVLQRNLTTTVFFYFYVSYLFTVISQNLNIAETKILRDLTRISSFFNGTHSTGSKCSSLPWKY